MNKVFESHDSSVINLSNPKGIDLQNQPKSTGIQGNIDIVFKNLCYSVETTLESDTSFFCKSKIEKKILDNVSGICKGKQVTAIMGASGSGKTTLLNVLSCRINFSNNLTGQILANKHNYQLQEFGRFGNYVMQKDILFQALTVRETLEFAADLKLAQPKEEKQKKINDLIKRMKLQKCEDVEVGGNIIKGISGGQKKRVSIAFQLISDPKVILLDQPTSGLDSLTAFIICKNLHQLAHNFNKTVIMTIHQPSIEIFNLFDRLLLMAQGRLVYQGPTHKAQTHFEKIGFKTPQLSNPADYLMSILHQDSPSNVENYPKYFETYNMQLHPEIQHQIQSSETIPLTMFQREIKVSCCKSLLTLLWRDYINLKRNPLIFKSRLFQAIFTALITGGLFFGVNDDFSDKRLGDSTFYSLIGGLFLISMNTLIASLSPIILTFPKQRAVFIKQTSAQLYGVIPYFISRNIVQVPYLILIPLVSTLIAYWMIGLTSTAQQFFVFVLSVIALTFSGSSLGLLIGSMFSDQQVASSLAPAIFVPFTMVGGLFKNSGQLPDWIVWLEYISPIKYGFIALTRNQLDQRESPIDQLGLDMDLWPALGTLLGIAVAIRLLSLFFLWLFRSNIQ